MSSKLNSISFKLGLLFSGVFITLLLLLGLILYGVFTNMFVDYIKQDLLAKGQNHARILAEDFNQSAINHVVEMEKGVMTDVLVTDNKQQLVAYSNKPDKEMVDHLITKSLSNGTILEEDWKQHNYLISVTPIGDNLGYVYMYYPASILREIVFVMNLLLIVATIGILLLAFGLIGILSRRLTRPLLYMKEATSKMAMGMYKQNIPVNGNDEVAQLGLSIKNLGDQLQYFEESRSDFLAAVSHELRTPLTYLKGYSDILNKDIIKDRKDQKEYLTIINKEAHRLSILINDLFEMSKLQTGQFVLKKELTNINQVIRKVTKNLNPVANEKGIGLILNLIEELPEISIDPQRMEQVIYNLIENAIKYTSQGTITIKSTLIRDFIVLQISDTGIGIPSEDLPKIWERFYRVDQSRTRKTGGSGLGLYVVKQIIDAHNGNIQVKSKENEGSVFTIYLEKEENNEKDTNS